VTRRDGVMTLIRREATPGRGKGGDDASWIDTNLIGQKMKKIHMIDSAGTNER
jgi:hypothetical protein